MKLSASIAGIYCRGQEFRGPTLLFSAEALRKWISKDFFGSKIFSIGAVLFGKVKDDEGDILDDWLGEFSLFLSSSTSVGGTRSGFFFVAKEPALFDVDDSGVGQVASTSTPERAVFATLPFPMGLMALKLLDSRSFEAIAILERYLSVTLLSRRTGATRSTTATSVDATSMIGASTADREASSTDGSVLRVSASRDS